MTLSIRMRLTLWYAAIVVVVLTAASAAMVSAQSRIGLRRLDDELERLASAFLTIVANELDERMDLQAAARDAAAEVDIRGRTLIVMSSDGRLLATNQNAEGPNPSILVALQPSTRFTTLSTPVGEMRLITVSAEHSGRGYTVRVAGSLEGLARDRSSLVEALGVGLGLALLLAALGGWIIGRQALRPLSSMAHETSAMTALTRETRLSLPQTRDELEQLGRSFNGLLDRLDVALSAQRQFMADASHELRTPVSVTRTTAQVTLGQSRRTEQEYRESLTIIAEQAERLTRMVDDMFLLARADAYARPLEETPIYLDELVDECARAVRVLAEARRVVVRVTGARDASFVGDENLLRQLLINLLENAVSHTPSGGHVTIELAQTTHSVKVVVDDSGPGVGAADRERIFERFVRLGPSGGRGGAGLGLPIARWIAERHGGTLTLESSAPAGARFVLTLPNRQAIDTSSSPAA